MSAEAHFEIFPADDGFRWRAQAANGELVGHSVQAFRDPTDARRAIDDHMRTVLFASGLDPDMPLKLDVIELDGPPPPRDPGKASV